MQREVICLLSGDGDDAEDGKPSANSLPNAQTVAPPFVPMVNTEPEVTLPVKSCSHHLKNVLANVFMHLAETVLPVLPLFSSCTC